MTAGEKIKALRKEKNLTQSALTEGLITRNMLSQIENGVANPSLSTLSAISERLSVPLEYLLSDSASAGDMERLKNREKVRGLYAEGKKDECAELLGKYDDDESALISALCYAESGAALMHAGKLFSARREFEKSVDSAGKSVFAGVISACAKRGIALIDYVMGRGELPPCGVDEYGYILLLEVPSSLASSHAEARRLMKSGETGKAAGILSSLLPDAEKSGAICLYYVLSDLEVCLKAEGDIAGAYGCAERRLAIKEEMSR